MFDKNAIEFIYLDMKFILFLLVRGIKLMGRRITSGNI